jgi:hypothetical protein
MSEQGNICVYDILGVHPEKGMRLRRSGHRHGPEFYRPLPPA